MWVCIPEPFWPNSGLGMNVACQPYFIAYSLTVMRYVMQSSAIFIAGAWRMSTSCWDGPTSWWEYSTWMPSCSSASTVSRRTSEPASSVVRSK